MSFRDEFKDHALNTMMLDYSIAERIGEHSVIFVYAVHFLTGERDLDWISTLVSVLEFKMNRWKKKDVENQWELGFAGLYNLLYEDARKHMEILKEMN